MQAGRWSACGSGRPKRSQFEDFLGGALTLAYAVVVAVPNWLGGWLAVRARKGGAGPAAAVALWQSPIVGLDIAAFVVIAS